MGEKENTNNIMTHQEPSDEIKAFWKAKKCPSCGHPQRWYELNGIIFLNSHLGFEAFIKSGQYEKMPYPISALSAINYFELLRVVLTHTCPRCKFISMWNANEADVFALLSLSSEDIGINILIEEDILRDAAEHETTRARRMAFEAMINWLAASKAKAGEK